MEIENQKNESLHRRKIYPFFMVASLLILFDQATKLYFKGFNLFGIVHEGAEYGMPNPVIGDFLLWTFIENPGMAFGIEFGAGKIFLSLFSVFASIGLAWLIVRISQRSIGILIGFTLIFAGAVGNLIDRVFYGVFYGYAPLFYGKVVDFVQVDIPDIDFLGWTHFPIFNVADSCVTVGVVFLIIFHKHLPEWHDIFPQKETNTIETENIQLINETESKISPTAKED
ncbi:MAG: signal peptidase II [Candidatus Kapabacteria bacterium]|nr:signal peptidase II [Candidatus Kapabacteria bacterium]